MLADEHDRLAKAAIVNVGFMVSRVEIALVEDLPVDALQFLQPQFHFLNIFQLLNLTAQLKPGDCLVSHPGGHAGRKEQQGRG